MKSQKGTKIIILAGGKGTRMGGYLPKVLSEVKGKSMIKWLLEAVRRAAIDETPVIVVGYKKDMVMEELGDKYHYVVQEEQLGTGHAINLTREYLKDKAKDIIVLYGDHPFTTAETIQKINEKHQQSGKKITMATVTLPDFKDWRTNFEKFSRIIRDSNGDIVRDVQFKDATEEEKKITEVNPCYFCFDADWLWSKLENLKNDNAQKEYYLTDVIRMATENLEIESISIEPHEALGANTKEELETLEKLVS